MTFDEQLRGCKERVQAVCAGMPAPYPAFTLFFSVSDGRSRARVIHARADSFEQAWEEGATQMSRWVHDRALAAPWLRVDWVEGVVGARWAEFNAQLQQVKRNYFRFGLALDAAFDTVFTEQELNANAMLYGGGSIEHAVFNAHNVAVYGKQRYMREVPTRFAAHDMVYLLSTGGVFCQADGGVHKLAGTGLDAGRRQLSALQPANVMELVRSGADFLARQVQDNGLFIYGYFPCFDRRIPTYNTLRHASSLYAMVEAFELARDATLRAAIDRGIDHLVTQLIRDYTLPDGREAAFLVDVGDEIKLGGNAVCLLALVKYCEVMDTRRWLPLLEKLALGIEWMQDAATGRFNHVLNATDLSLKQATRIIYYDGEAAFGLMRLYGLTRDPRWLAVVEKAFEHFIASQHWQAHDHWLSYCVNELTRWLPHEKYFRFGIQNVAGYLDFVLDRKTTFPTLLELMLAAQQMLTRLQAMPALRHLLDELDLEKFHRALDYRAHYLLNGHFWPEMAMYFRKPSSILGSFFIRHHSFRVRIDDVEHYLSGFVAYHRHLLETRAPMGAGAAAVPAREDDPSWSAPELARVAGGVWLVPPEEGWHAGGLAQRSFLRKGRMEIAPVVRAARASSVSLNGVLQPASAVLCTDAAPHLDKGVPVLRVPDVRRAMLALGAHARARYAGRVIGVVGGGGRAPLADMLSHALAGWGEVARPEGNINLPNGLAWNMTCMPRLAPAWVLELAGAQAPALARLARPTLALVADGAALPGGLRERIVDQDAIARREAACFDAMAAGAPVVLCRDLPAYPMLEEAARGRHLAVLSYGTHEAADVRMESFDHGELRARIGHGEVRLRLNAPGHAIGMCALGVLAALTALRLPVAAALEALAAFEPADGRGVLHTVHIGGGSFRLIDETHDANPASMRAALELLAQAPCSPAQRVAILGDMQDLGPDARRHHAGLATPLLASEPDRVLLCGPQMEALHTQIRTRVRSQWFADVADLSNALGALLRPGDWVLAKSSAGTGLSRLARALRTLP